MTTPGADERTVIKSAPSSGAVPRAFLPGEFPDALPAATRLHEFEILSVIGQGGFGIVYLAHDLSLDRRVAIKEYMPSELATRTQAMTVAVRSSRHTETFAAGLRSFVNEARLLAQFDHPSLLKVHRFWEAHGTAYMVMPYYAGITLAKLLTQLGSPPDEARLHALLNPLLDALAQMHAAHCFHRDIAPDNILILPDGTPLLLDFGAARRVIGDMTQALTVILKTGYAPVEQYGAMPDMSQGAWTDLYALGSVVEFAITGRTPPQAITRYLADKRQPLAVAAAGRYSDGFLRAIDRSLAVLPKDRPQSAAAMRALLAQSPHAVAPADRSDVKVPIGVPAPPPRPVERDVHVRPRAERVTVAAPDLAPATAPARAPVEPAPDPMVPATTAAAASTQASRRGVAVGSVALLFALVVVAGYAWFGSTQPRVPEPAAPAAPTVLPTAPSAAAQATPTIQDAPAALPGPSLPAPSLARSSSVTELEPPTIPKAAPSAAPSVAEAQRPAPRVAPRVARAPAPETHSPPHTPNKKLPNTRCADIIQRVSLGEPLSDAEKTLLKQECGP